MSVTPTKALIDISKLENLADKVRAKTGTSDLMTVDEMATAVENIPSGGGDGSLEMLGQMDTRVYCNSDGNVATNSSYPGPYSTFVYALPSGTVTRISVLVQKYTKSNRFRAVFTADNPLNIPVPSKGVLTTGAYKAIVSDSNSSSYLTAAASTDTSINPSYLVLNISGNSGTEQAPKVWACIE